MMKTKGTHWIAAVLLAAVTVTAGNCGSIGAVSAAEDVTQQEEAVIVSAEEDVWQEEAAAAVSDDEEENKEQDAASVSMEASEEPENIEEPMPVEEDRFLDPEYIVEYGDTPTGISDVVDTSQDGLLKWVISADGTLTISGNGEMNDYESASLYPWYTYKENIRNVVLESGVTSIGSYAFEGCTNLSTVTMPSTLTSIGQYAFEGCISLTPVTLPDKLETIGAGAFANTCLTEIAVPASVTEIGDEAFSGCSLLVTVTLSEGLTKIGAKAFMNCSKIEKISLPGTLTEIGSMAFVNTALTSVMIPKSVTSVESYAVGYAYGTTGLTKISGFVIYCYDASAARAYSVEYGMTYVLMNLSLYTVTLEKYSYTYTGEEITPAVTVRNGTTVLTLDEDYTVEYTNNINVGEATVTVTGIGDYVDTLTATFSIIQASITKCTATVGTTGLVYSSVALQPKLTVTLGSYSLVSGTDYTVSYSNNVNAGTASYTLTGKGNFIGILSGTFTIAKSSQSVVVGASATTVTVGETVEITATGKGAITYTSSDTSIATVDSNGVVTTKKPGTVKITATAAGNSNYESGSTTIKLKVKLAKGTISSLTNKSSGVTVKWKQIMGASGYYIYRRTSSGNYSLIATIEKASTVSYTDTEIAGQNGIGYYYKVVPYSGSTIGSGTAKKIVRLTGTTLSAVTNSSSGKIKVTWNATTKVNGYQIQYSTDKTFETGSKTKKVSGKTKVSKTLSGLTTGATYYVRIRTYRTVNGTTYYSAWSSKQAVKITK